MIVELGQRIGIAIAGLVSFGLAVHLVEAVLRVGKRSCRGIDGLFSGVPVDQLVHLKNYFLAHQLINSIADLNKLGKLINSIKQLIWTSLAASASSECIIIIAYLNLRGLE